MRLRRFGWIAAVAAAGACGPPPAAELPLSDPVPEAEPAPEPPFLFPHSIEFRLDNGLAVERLAVPGDRVAIVLGIRAGPVTEPPGLPGLARFTAALAPEGTRRHTGDELRRRLDQAGGSLVVRIDRDGVALEVDVAADGVPAALEVLSEIAREAVFPEAALERFREREREALAVASSDPAWLARRVWLREVYGDHPYAREDAGEAAVAMLRREQLATFHHDRWAADGAFLVVAGSIPVEELRPLVETAFGRWRTGAPPPLPIPATPPPGPRRILLIDRPESDRLVVMAGGAGPGMRDPRAPAIALAAAILGGGDDARLLASPALQAAGASTAGAWFEEAERGGPAFVFLEARAASAEAVLDELFAGLGRLRSAPPDPSESAAARASLLRELRDRAADSSGVARMAALARFWDVAPGFWGAVEERLADASPQAAQSAAAAFLSDESAVLVVAGPAAAVLEPCRRWSSVVEVEPDGSRGRTWPRR